MEKDELDAIFVDKNEPADKKIIVEILKPFVTIDSEANLSFTEEYDKLNDQDKALVYLVCKKAMVLKGIKDVSEPAGPLEISQKATINESNAKNALYTKYKKILKKEGNGYVIPNYNLKKIKDILKSDKNG